MQRIAEKLEFQTDTLGEVHQRNDSQLPNSCFDYYFGRQPQNEAGKLEFLGAFWYSIGNGISRVADKVMWEISG